jgi:transcriptional regulator with XRE-family HTH domain
MDELGQQLRRVRQLKNLSLQAVAGPAEISPTYLQKLEQGAVKSPSPPVLHRLAKALDLPYTALMEAAGYLERAQRDGMDNGNSNLLAHALMGEDLTVDEARALADYLAFIRQRRNPGSGSPSAQ